MSQPAPKTSGKGLAAGAAAVIALAAVVVAKWEGLEYKVYPDPATGGAPYTVCYGHTGPEVRPGQTYTKAQCEALLEQDLAVAQRQLRRCIARPMPASVEAAYVSLIFNVGPGPVCINGKAPRAALLAGNWPAACAALDRYKFAAGRVMRGLVRRRADERKLCESGI